MALNHVRRGSGSPLLLVHGLGSGWRSWSPILDELAEHREVIAVDLPGFGETPRLTGEVSIATLTDSVADFIREQGLDGVSTVGQSMGGRMVLELARRGVGGDTVALDPGGFWSDREVVVFGATLRPSIGLVRALRGMLPVLLGSPVGRTLLLVQLSARPGRSRARPCCRTCAGWPTPQRLALPWTP
ncbi:alpha/beta hydrolase [Tomitella cavernea]|uniref:AB hydrolase-1 domain-containing protein n=1 Tax=Tomitella cavernea TaxID=1387982 RepID=A0ABP9D524_9ACTN